MYVNSSLAKVEAIKAGYDEAILLAPDGNVSECTGENIFVVRDGRLLTPPSSDSGALEGITQKSVETIARDLGHEVALPAAHPHRPVHGRRGLPDRARPPRWCPIRAVDDRTVGPASPGPITQQIQQTYFAAVRGEVDRYKDWLDYVE